MAEKFKITYATLSADNPQMHRNYEEGIEHVRSWMGTDYPFYVNGEARRGDEYEEERSPIDHDVLIGRFGRATEKDVDDAVTAAGAGFNEWSSKPWEERVAILERAADDISEHIYELSACVAYEAGKNRLEALGEVEEAADLIRYYCRMMNENDGFVRPMEKLSEIEHTYSVLKPFGVWGVISPFNFPAALSIGPAGGALVAGNAVVLKPSEQGYLIALKLYEILIGAGVPQAAFHILTGQGEIVGAALATHPGVDGLTFTGSFEVGFGLYKNFAKDFPKPIITEMGGKNPTIVSDKADLDKATDGVLRSAFGYSGQKCSACSRVLVQRDVYDDFVRLLVEKTQKIVVGDPLRKEVYMGPVIFSESTKRFEDSVAEAQRTGKVLTGGEVITEGAMARGNFVEPTVVEVARDSDIWRKELFLPFVALSSADSLDEAMADANDTPYGLTAGFYSEDRDEVQWFLDRIKAGVVYVNRRAGATTGAWPGVQPFGGWKGSGSSGKAGGGPYYVQLYMREQSQTVVEE
jgi:1-pyrroline-5-carboxylate dehydrogenase